MSTGYKPKQFETMCLIAMVFGALGIIIGVMDAEQGHVIGGSILVSGGLIALGVYGRK